MRQSLPERDDDDDLPVGMPSWSWGGIVLLVTTGTAFTVFVVWLVGGIVGAW